MGGATIETQESACELACNREEYTVIDTLKDEAISAKESGDINKRRLADLYNYCVKNSGKFDVLMVFKLNRFARSVEQHSWLRARLREHGILLRSATESINESPEGKLMENVLASIAQFDNDVKSVLVKKNMWQRVEQGLWPFPPPFGYKPQVHEGRKIAPYIQDDYSIDSVKYIFKVFSEGHVSKSLIASELTTWKVMTYRGQKVNWSPQLVFKILNNPFYKGFLKHEDGRLIRGLHEPCVEPEVFERCQTLQEVGSKQIIFKKTFNDDFPLKGHVYCDKCGTPLTACWSKGKFKKYAYYYCQTKECIRYGKMIRRNDLEGDYLKLLRNIKPSASAINEFELGFVGRYKERESEIKGEYLRTLKDIQDLEKQEEWVVEMARKGTIPEHLVRKQLDDLEQQLVFAKASLDDSYKDELDIQTLISYAKTFFRKLDMIWVDAAPKAKARLQNFIFPDGVTYHFSGISNSVICPLFQQLKAVAGKKSYYGEPKVQNIELSYRMITGSMTELSEILVGVEFKKGL